MTEPMFGCQLQGCAEEVSYHADMLMMHGGEPICQGCYEICDIGLTEDSPDWCDLPAFIPEHVSTLATQAAQIAELEAEIARLRKILIHANNVWRHDFSVEVDAAADKLFKRLSATQTDPFARAALSNDPTTESAQ